MSPTVNAQHQRWGPDARGLSGYTRANFSDQPIADLSDLFKTFVLSVLAGSSKLGLASVSAGSRPFFVSSHIDQVAHAFLLSSSVVADWKMARESLNETQELIE